MDQAGSQKSGRIRSWGRVGSDSRSSWERYGSLVPWTDTCARALDTSNRDSPAGNALVSPGPFGGARSGIGGANHNFAGRCPSRKRFSVDERLSWTQPLRRPLGASRRQVATRTRGDRCLLAAGCGATYDRAVRGERRRGDRPSPGRVLSLGAGTNYKYNRKGALFTPPNCACVLLRINQDSPLVCAL